MIALLIAVPLLPLIAGAAALGLGRHFRWGGGELVLAATVLSLLALLALPDGGHVSAIWIESGGYRLTVGLEVTRFTGFIAMVVAGTAVGVCLYSLGYMAGNAHRPRFFAELGLFIGAMLSLVLADSFLILFAAWELVGAASYLLIAFHHEEPGAPEAATKAFLMTRIGDVGLVLGWLLALAATGTTEIAAFLGAAENGQLGAGPATVMALLMLAGAVGKSAQLPLTVWLPDAMIGPTPVSALIHSATMVAAGVFLIVRLYPFFMTAPAALVVLTWIGAATALVSAAIATAETDLKRILAWSTSSQLGEMMIALGLGGPVAATFHLTTHAAFKSTLFLAAGAVQEQAGTRDLRKLGGLIRTLPFTGGAFVVAALALAGIPPLAGFWSEDAILVVAEHHDPAAALLIVLLIFLAGVYIGRAVTATFFGERRSETTQIREPGWIMLGGVALLVLATICVGWLLEDRIAALLPSAVPLDLGAGASRLAAIAASFVGFGLGAARGWRGASTWLPADLGAGLTALTVAPARWVERLAGGAVRVEKALDNAARWAPRLVGGTTTLEKMLDDAVRRTASAVWRLALGAHRVETQGFGRGGDRLAAEVAVGGETLRIVQSGKIYLYTFALFVWAAAVLLVAGVMLWI